MHYEGDWDSGYVDVYSRMYATHDEVDAIGRRRGAGHRGSRRSTRTAARCRSCSASTRTRWATGRAACSSTSSCSRRTRAAWAGSSGSGSTTASGRRRRTAASTSPTAATSASRCTTATSCIDGLVFPDRTPSPGLIELEGGHRADRPRRVERLGADHEQARVRRPVARALRAGRWPTRPACSATGELAVPTVAAGRDGRRAAAGAADDRHRRGLAHRARRARRRPAVGARRARAVRGAAPARDRAGRSRSSERRCPTAFDERGRLTRLGDLAGDRAGARPVARDDRQRPRRARRAAGAALARARPATGSRTDVRSVERDGDDARRRPCARRRPATDLGMLVDLPVDGHADGGRAAAVVGRAGGPVGRAAAAARAAHGSCRRRSTRRRRGSGSARARPTPTARRRCGSAGTRARSTSCRRRTCIPQENGNRRAVRWAELAVADGAGLRIASSGTFDLTVRRWTSEDLEAARHTTDLVPRDQVFVNLDVGAERTGHRVVRAGRAAAVRTARRAGVARSGVHADRAALRISPAAPIYQVWASTGRKSSR